jgi:hypothetical protein
MCNKKSNLAIHSTIKDLRIGAISSGKLCGRSTSGTHLTSTLEALQCTRSFGTLKRCATKISPKIHLHTISAEPQCPGPISAIRWDVQQNSPSDIQFRYLGQSQWPRAFGILSRRATKILVHSLEHSPDETLRKGACCSTCLDPPQSLEQPQHRQNLPKE